MIGLLPPGFWWSIGLQVATAPVTDFFEVLDSRPPQTGPPATPPAEDTEDVFAIPHKVAA